MSELPEYQVPHVKLKHKGYNFYFYRILVKSVIKSCTQFGFRLLKAHWKIQIFYTDEQLKLFWSWKEIPHCERCETLYLFSLWKKGSGGELITRYMPLCREKTLAMRELFKLAGQGVRCNNICNLKLCSNLKQRQLVLFLLILGK